MKFFSFSQLSLSIVAVFLSVSGTTAQAQLSSFRIVQTQKGPIADIQIDPLALKSVLEQLSGARPTIIGGQSIVIKERRSPEGRELARRFLSQALSQMGYSVGIQKYNEGANLIAERAGSGSSGFVVVSFHLDSVGNAGANDDGSGAVSALAIAQVLSRAQTKYGIRIIGFDNEENGLWGSRAYIQSFKGQKPDIVAAFHMEQMGYNGRNDGAFHSIDCNRPDSRPLTAKIAQAASAQGLRIEAACTDRSDHYWYWQANVPAVVISENFFGGDFDPCYHKACDVVDSRLNFEYMSRIAESVAGAALNTAMGF